MRRSQIFKIFLLGSVLCNLQAAVAENASPIRIGVLAELSGPFAKNGEDCRRGFEVARREWVTNDSIGGRRVQIFYGDSKGDSAVGVTEFKRLTDQEHVQAVVFTRSLIGMALNPVSRQSKIPVLGVVGHPQFTVSNPYAFRVFPSAQLEGTALAKAAKDRKLLRVAAVTLEDDYTLAVTQAFRTALEAAGGSLVSDITLVPGEADVRPILTRMREANPEALLINAGIPQAGLLFKKARELGMRQQILSNFWAGLEDVRNGAGSAAEGVIFVEPNLVQAALRHGLEQQFQSGGASAVTLSCYAAGAASFQAVAAAPDLAGSQDFYAALKALSVIKLPDGELRLENRELLFPLEIKTVKSGAVETVSSVEY